MPDGTGGPRHPTTTPAPPGRRRWRVAAALAGALLVAPAGVRPPADAHASLVRSAPAHRAILGRMPERVQLWFNERLEPAYSTVSVWSEAGAQVDGRDATVGPDDPRRLSVTVPAGEPGRYTVTYRVLSVDGHIVDSRFTFTVKGQSP